MDKLKSNKSPNFHCCSSKNREYSKNLLRFLLFGVFLWQVGLSISKLMDGQMATVISYETEESTWYPSFTLCAKFRVPAKSSKTAGVVPLLEQYDELMKRAFIPSSAKIRTGKYLEDGELVDL